MRQRYFIPAVLFASLFCLPFSAIAKSEPEAAPSLQEGCTSCGYNKQGCASCLGGGTATFCVAFSCGACEQEGQCNPLPTRASQAISDSAKQQHIRLSEKVIRQIAALHPRFAITLIEMNGFGFSPGKRTVFWTPVELTSSAVDAFLSKGTHGSFFDQYDEKARSLNRLIQAGELSSIVYSVSIENTDGLWSIKLQVQGDLATVDPAFSTLEIQVKAKASQGAQTGQTQNKERWEIR